MKQIAVALLFSVRMFAAISASTVWEVRPTNGTDTNGAGFVTGASGTDMSQFDAKNAAGCSGCQSATVNISTTDGVTNGTTTITSATGNYSAALVGNIINISGGTGGVASNWYQVLTVPGSTSFTVDRSTGLTAGTGVTINIGGALQTLTQLNTNMGLTANTQAWVKAESTIATASTITLNPGSNSSSNRGAAIQGYATTRGDGGMVTVQASGALGNTRVINITSAPGLAFRNFIIDCNSQTGAAGIQAAGAVSVTLEYILVKNCTVLAGVAFNNQQQVCRFCIVTGQAAGASFILEQSNGPNYCWFCAAIAGTTTGFQYASGFCDHCISANNTGASSDCFSLIGGNTGPPAVYNSIAYKCGRDGVRFVGGATTTVLNTVLYGNTGVGLNNTTGTSPLADTFNFNAFGANGTARTNVTAGANDVALTSDPYSSGGSNVFTINNTVGGGAALRAAAFGVFSVGGVSLGQNYGDIGTLQHQDTGGGGTGQSGGPIIQ